MEEKVEMLSRIIWPYIQEIVAQVLSEKANLEEATVESLTELICYKAESTVRKIVKELNEKARNKEYEELVEVIRSDPELAKKASNYVAKRFKRRIRKLIAAELERRKNSGAVLQGKANPVRDAAGPAVGHQR